MHNLVMLLALLISLFLTNCASSRASGDAEARADQILQKLDENNDSKISKSEIKFPLNEKTFDKSDTNADGYLEKAEIVAYIESR